MDSENKIYQIPEFTGENIPLMKAARIMGKDYQFVRIGIIEGFLPIGTALECLAQIVIHFTSVQGCSGNTRGMCIVGKR